MFMATGVPGRGSRDGVRDSANSRRAAVTNRSALVLPHWPNTPPACHPSCALTPDAGLPIDVGCRGLALVDLQRLIVGEPPLASVRGQQCGLAYARSLRPRYSRKLPGRRPPGIILGGTHAGNDGMGSDRVRFPR